jgi:hypothetical protein
MAVTAVHTAAQSAAMRQREKVAGMGMKAVWVMKQRGDMSLIALSPELKLHTTPYIP